MHDNSSHEHVSTQARRRLCTHKFMCPCIDCRKERREASLDRAWEEFRVITLREMAEGVMRVNIYAKK